MLSDVNLAISAMALKLSKWDETAIKVRIVAKIRSESQECG